MRRPTFAVVTALIALLMLGAQAVPAAAATTAFGAKITTSTQPQPFPEKCADQPGSGSQCTWVAVQAFENGGHQAAPKPGTIHKLKLVTCVAGSFTLQIAKPASGGKYKVVRNGPSISYPADPSGANCGDATTFKIRTFNVSVHVNKGELLAVRASKVGFVHCSSSGDSQIFRPALVSGGTARTPQNGGCGLLLRAIY
ncbi:MAG: hypothetical protein U0869_18890 [Chloroflexota bacterium]